jgi:asparagine synthase (glutamine-hydrolysing)
MCGILTIVSLKDKCRTGQLIDATTVISHRGPDDEGFLTWAGNATPTVWAGNDTAASTRQHWKYPELTRDTSFKVGFGHRRLSILDLSPLGHQPMLLPDGGLAITFNGEVYNYLEIKEELSQKGHRFLGTSDTEVILHAWQEWGEDCLHKFNGMFALVVLDYKKNELYAIRDRFGVKPVFYYQNEEAFYIASEIKQIKTAPGYKLNLNIPIVKKYLATGAVDYTDATFDTQIRHLKPGHLIRFDLSGNPSYTIKKWYTLTPKPWSGTYEEATVAYKNLLKDAVKLRLRADVKVGSCLSGGLDSSSIVCLAAQVLNEGGDFAGQETVTACYSDARFDEWNFAKEVIDASKAVPHQIFPSFTDLLNEIDSFLWFQDEPTGSTSQFSQWSVFKKTGQVGLKVMIDGQGADEQLAGYGGNDIPYYADLMKKMHLSALIDEVKAYKKNKGSLPLGFLLGALPVAFGEGVGNLIPRKFKPAPRIVAWLKGNESAALYEDIAPSLQDNLMRQLYGEPLPALLRYEDHNSMAWSVESRTPFLDYRLVEFTLGLPPRYVYKNGVRKTILRDAMHGIIPEKIENRKDKMGFVTPEELWLKGEGKSWFSDNITAACNEFGESILNADAMQAHLSDMISGKSPFSFSVWRVVCFYKWYIAQPKN